MERWLLSGSRCYCPQTIATVVDVAVQSWMEHGSTKEKGRGLDGMKTIKREDLLMLAQSREGDGRWKSERGMVMLWRPARWGEDGQCWRSRWRGDRERFVSVDIGEGMKGSDHGRWNMAMSVEGWNMAMSVEGWNMAMEVPVVEDGAGQFEGIEPPFPHLLLRDLAVLDLSSNMLEGSVPTTPPSINFFSVSKNRLSGEIPLSICNATSLDVLNLSSNELTGGIPQCLGEISDVLSVLNLQGNAFDGILLQAFKEGCNLQTLDLSENQFKGQVLTSLANCKKLEILNLGTNQIHDTFPLWTKDLSQLRVLVLRSNRFYGPVASPLEDRSFPMLQIINLSSNSFTGSLPEDIFQSWKVMTEEDKSQTKFFHKTGLAHSNVVWYKDTLVVASKGLEMKLTKVLTIFTGVDLSNNCFQGDIPESIGILKSLRVLNMSHNSFKGQIPRSLEKLTVLESLDLSQNKISGEIPWQLTKLTFLSVLNLSQNHLNGSIPQVRQFLTFTNESFQGNPELCGPPLTRKCGEVKGAKPPAFKDAVLKSESEYDWEVMSIGLGIGFGVGMGAFFWTLTLWTKGRREYNRFIDGMSF